MRQRKLNRLRGYDYAKSGAYFITICAKNRECLFGNIENGKMILNVNGEIVKKQWQWLAQQYNYVQIDEYIVMPDHFHGIIVINPAGNGCSPVGNSRDCSLRGSGSLQMLKIKPLPELIGAFKTTSSKQIHLVGAKNFQWQKSYHDRIIRNDDELNRIRYYIVNNPINWENDQHNE